MDTTLTELFSSQEAKALCWTFILAVLGGLAKLCSRHKQVGSYRRRTDRLWIYIIISAFSGLMASYLVDYMHFPVSLQKFCIGMSGFGGPAILMFFIQIYKKKIGIGPEETFELAGAKESNGKKRMEEEEQ